MRQVIQDTCPDTVCIELDADIAKAHYEEQTEVWLLQSGLLPALTWDSGAIGVDLGCIFGPKLCMAAASVPLFPLAWCAIGLYYTAFWGHLCGDCLARLPSSLPEGDEMTVAICEGRHCGSQLYAIGHAIEMDGYELLCEMSWNST